MKILYLRKIRLFVFYNYLINLTNKPATTKVLHFLFIIHVLANNLLFIILIRPMN